MLRTVPGPWAVGSHAFGVEYRAIDPEWSKNSAEHQCLWQQGFEFGEKP